MEYDDGFSLYNYVFMLVSQKHKCGKNPELRTRGVKKACMQQFAGHENGPGSVPCHVTRARVSNVT